MRGVLPSKETDVRIGDRTPARQDNLLPCSPGKGVIDGIVGKNLHSLETLPIIGCFRKILWSILNNRATCDIKSLSSPPPLHLSRNSHWGWAGFTTSRYNTLSCYGSYNSPLFINWWSIFIRLVIPHKHYEARTSRSLFLKGPGRLIHHGRNLVLKLTSIHGHYKKKSGI